MTPAAGAKADLEAKVGEFTEMVGKNAIAIRDADAFAQDSRKRIEALEEGQKHLQTGQENHTGQLKAIGEQIASLGGANKASSELILTTINSSTSHTQELFQKLNVRIESSDTLVANSINRLYQVFGLDPEKPEESGQRYIRLRDAASDREKTWKEIKLDAMKWAVRLLLGVVAFLVVAGFVEWVNRPHTATTHTETEKVVQERTTNIEKPK